MKKLIHGAACVLAALCAQPVLADVGIGLRGGTLGFGADLDIGMTERLSLRLAYNYLNYDRTIDDTGVRYDGTLKVGSPSAYLDWHPFAGGVRFSLGAVASGPKIEVVGTPTGGNYQIGNDTYTAAQVGSLRGEIKLGNSVAPYLGIGYGNVVSEKHRVTLLLDLGAIYGGTPNVSLAAQCGNSVPTNVCTQLQNDVAVEIQDLKNQVTAVKWYPVINIGLGIRF